jgi:4-amino-4-deoxy-L-arabinose transferase-like glycosyltransferase
VVRHALVWARSGQFKRKTTFSKFVLVTVSSAVSLLLLCLLTAPFAPLFDPDEGYYPATAAESVASGSAWDPRLNGEPRCDKPILPYALIEGAFSLFGRRVAAARVPSALQDTALVLVVGFLVWRLAGPRAGALSAVIVSTTAGIQIFSRVAHPEIGVVLSVVTTELLLCLWLIWPVDAARLHLAVAAGVSVGYGVLAYTTTAYGHRRSVLFFIIPTAIALLPWTAFLPQASARITPRCDTAADASNVYGRERRQRLCLLLLLIVETAQLRARVHSSTGGPDCALVR